MDIGAFMANLRKEEGFAARGLEFLVLTACRSNEVRGATWQEIDLKARMWTIPPQRMKMGKEHRVPLSDAAIGLLQKLPRVDGAVYVFPSVKAGATLSDMAMTAVLRRMNVEAVPHGFRSTFRDWAGESTNFPREVCEHALAHRLADGVEAAYQRGDMLQKRTAMMQEWANSCARPPNRRYRSTSKHPRQLE
jgi:integrase